LGDVLKRIYIQLIEKFKSILSGKTPFAHYLSKNGLPIP